MDKKSSTLIPISEILEQRVMGESRMTVLNLLGLVRQWPEVVGGELAKRATPMRIHGGTLTLQAVSATWANELQFMALELLEKIRAHCPQLPVQRLRFIS